MYSLHENGTLSIQVILLYLKQEIRNLVETVVEVETGHGLYPPGLCFWFNSESDVEDLTPI